jgi:hypothetical protein
MTSLKKAPNDESGDDAESHPSADGEDHNANVGNAPVKTKKRRALAKRSTHVDEQAI